MIISRDETSAGHKGYWHYLRSEWLTSQVALQCTKHSLFSYLDSNIAPNDSINAMMAVTAAVPLSTTGQSQQQ